MVGEKARQPARQHESGEERVDIDPQPPACALGGARRVQRRFLDTVQQRTHTPPETLPFVRQS
jgi:hypothetical protein